MTLSEGPEQLMDSLCHSSDHGEPCRLLRWQNLLPHLKSGQRFLIHVCWPWRAVAIWIGNLHVMLPVLWDLTVLDMRGCLQKK